MRLNFSGVSDDDIREGVRRIGEVVARAGRPLRHADRREPPAPAAAPRRGAAPDPDLADVLHLPRRVRAGRRADAPMSRVAVLKGGALAGAPGLAAVRRARRGRARAPRPRGHRHRRRRAISSRGCASGARTSRSSRCTAATARTARAGAAGDPRHPLHRLGRVGLHALRRQGARQARACVDAGLPTPDFFAFTETAFKELGAAEALRRHRGAPRASRSSSSPPTRAARWACASRATRGRRARARSSPRSPTRTRCCSSATSHGRDLAVSVARRRARCRSSRRSRARRTSTTSTARYEIGRTSFVCPADARRRADRARAGARARRVPAARLPRLRPHRPACSTRRRASSTVLEANAIPGLTETSLLPQAADAAGIGFDALIGADRRAGAAAGVAAAPAGLATRPRSPRA